MKTSPFVIALLFILSFITTITSAQTKVLDNQLKKSSLPLTNALNTVNQLQPLTFEYDQTRFGNLRLPAGTQYGFNADEVRRVLPAVVKKESILFLAGKNQYRSADVNKVDIQSLVPVLLAAIKEQQQQIDSLKAEMQSLKQNHNTAAR
jgi:peptidoglycan hydrolase CwlO-like protein